MHQHYDRATEPPSRHARAAAGGARGCTGTFCCSGSGVAAPAAPGVLRRRYRVRAWGKPPGTFASLLTPREDPTLHSPRHLRVTSGFPVQQSIQVPALLRKTATLLSPNCPGYQQLRRHAWTLLLKAGEPRLPFQTATSHLRGLQQNKIVCDNNLNENLNRKTCGRPCKALLCQQRQGLAALQPPTRLLTAACLPPCHSTLCTVRMSTKVEHLVLIDIYQPNERKSGITQRGDSTCIKRCRMYRQPSHI